MTMEQRLEAEEMAAEWLKKTDKLLPASIERSTDRHYEHGEACNLQLAFLVAQ